MSFLDQIDHAVHVRDQQRDGQDLRLRRHFVCIHREPETDRTDVEGLPVIVTAPCRRLGRTVDTNDCMACPHYAHIHPRRI